MSSENASTALVPSLVRKIDFYEDPILIALVGEIAYVPLRPFCDHLGLSWSAQYTRIQRDNVLAEAVHVLILSGADERKREMICLPLEFLPGWLFTISSARAKPELEPKLKRYRMHCFRVLWEAYQAELTGHTLPSDSQHATVLGQVRDAGLAIAQLAENQMAIQEDIGRIDGRLDKAAAVVGDLQRRLSAVERRVGTAATITDEQAANVAMQVKALAELLASKDPSKNHYQSIFGEIYRRWAVSSYKLLKQGQYQNVLDFLGDWYQATVGNERQDPL